MAVVDLFSEGGQVPIPNDRLRQARQRTESPTHPGECLSRQELAELVNAHVWDQREQMVALDANYIGKLERGVICWPAEDYREAFRAVLGVSEDTSLGFTNRRRTVVRLDDVDRQQFLRGAALSVGGVALAPLVARLGMAEPTPTPARVGLTEIEQINTAARVFASWDHTYGGGLAREAVVAQLRWSTGLLDARCPARLRPRLHAAIGYLAHTCGATAFDANAHADARRAYRLSLACAEQAEDWHLRAKALSSMARQEIWLDHPDTGLTLVEHALVRADRLTATETAMLHTAHARAQAKMRRTRETLAAVGAADESFARQNSEDDPPWMSYYDAAQHAGDTGHALFDLAVHGHRPTAARERLSAAVAGHSATYTRSRTMSQAKLASLMLAVGDPHEGAAVGTAALNTAETLRSRRAAQSLHELAHYTRRHRDIAEITDLRQRITATLINR